jgi:hypothetical protein
MKSALSIFKAAALVLLAMLVVGAAESQSVTPFAGDKVTITGKVYERGGSKAIVIEKIESQK